MSVEPGSVPTTAPAPEEPCLSAGPLSPPVEAEAGAPATARQLVRAAILRGLLLDDPWRHAFLRHRWKGA